MTNIIVLTVIAVIVGSATIYIIKQKKKGVKCIGCPSGASCPHKGKCGGNHV